MNKDIKEILDNLKFTNNDVMWCDKITLDVEQSHLLLDYITNLQHQLEQKEAIIKEAIYYLEYELPYLQEIDEELENVNGETYHTYKEWTGQELIDTLQREDKGE